MKRNQFFSCKGIQMMLLAVMMLFGYSTTSTAKDYVLTGITKEDGALLFQKCWYVENGKRIYRWAVAGFAEGYEDRSLVTIPAEFQGEKVALIASKAFRRKENLQAVYFGEGAKVEIGSYAFEYCTNLSTFTSGDYTVITSIGDHAFAYCTSLQEFTIAQWVEEVGDLAFYGSGLKYLKTYVGENIKRIGNSAFANCKFTTIPTTCQMFRPRENGLNITVGSYLFAENPVTILEFPRATEEIPERCFVNCKSLKVINIEEVPIIREEAFYGCTNLNKTLTIGTNYKHIAPGAFKNTGLTTLVIGNNDVANALDPDNDYVKSRFGDDITSITFTDDVKGIADHWARNCYKLTKVTFPSVLENGIGDYAFENCPIEGTLQLTGWSLTSFIGKRAFANTCFSNVELRLVKLGESAFSGCKPQYFTCNSSVRAGVNSFDGLSVTKNLSIPNLDYAEGSFDYANIKKLTVTGTSINGDCMKNNTNITRVDFPNATSIEQEGRILEGSNVEMIAIPKLENIRQGYFGNAQKLYGLCNPETAGYLGEPVNNGHIKYALGGGQGTVYSADGKTLLYVLPGQDRIYLDKDVEYIDLNGTDFKRENDVMKWGALVMDATAINHKIKLIGDPELQACCRYLHIGLGCRKYFEDFTKMRYAPMLVQDAVQGDVNEDGKVSVADVMNVYDMLK